MNYVSREEIKMISASSAGIFTAYALSADKLGLMEQIYRSVNISKTVDLFWQVFAKGILPKYLNAIMDVEDDLAIPLCFPVCYIPLYSVRYYWIYGKCNSLWSRYFKAAINYPFLHLFPSFLNGRFAIDGGAADNIPLFPLLQRERPVCSTEKLDLIMVLHFDARYDYHRQFVTDTPVLDIDLSICNDFSKAHYNLSSEVMGERIDKSYEYGEKIFSRLFAGDGSRTYLQKIVDEIFLEEHALRQRNLSLDRFFSYLNQLGAALRNDARCTKKLF